MSTTKDILLEMSEGNFGALDVVMQILKKEDDSIFALLNLDAMDIRGAKLFVGYKYHCECNLEKFIEASLNKDQAMLDTIQKYALQGAC